VTQGRLRLHRIEVFRAYRAAVESLLASSNPGNPDHGNTDQAYDLSLQHLASDYRFLRARNPELRALIIDQVRRLHLRGGHVEAAKFGLSCAARSCLTAPLSPAPPASSVKASADSEWVVTKVGLPANLDRLSPRYLN
jgi:hypothetical protein